MSVPERRIVGVFRGEDEGAEEDAVERPLFGLDREVGSGAADVDEGHQDGGGFDLGGVEDGRDEVCEVGKLFGTSG